MSRERFVKALVGCQWLVGQATAMSGPMRMIWVNFRVIL